jgi:hypothetical protein
LGEIFFLLLICMCWLKIHKDLQLLSLFISFTSKTISNFLPFHDELLWEKPNTKILFSCFYSTLCKLACREMSYKSIYKIVLQSLWLGVNLNYYLIKYYSSIFKDSIRNPISISLCKQNYLAYLRVI